jgi:hypothetical protein
VESNETAREITVVLQETGEIRNEKRAYSEFANR